MRVLNQNEVLAIAGSNGFAEPEPLPAPIPSEPCPSPAPYPEPWPSVFGYMDYCWY